MKVDSVLVEPVDFAPGFAIVLLLLLQCPATIGDPKTLIDCTMLGQKLEVFVGLSLEESSEEWLLKEVEMGWRPVVFGIVVDLDFV